MTNPRQIIYSRSIEAHRRISFANGLFLGFVIGVVAGLRVWQVASRVMA